VNVLGLLWLSNDWVERSQESGDCNAEMCGTEFLFYNLGVEQNYVVRGQSIKRSVLHKAAKRKVVLLNAKKETK
jgi:hypothetical protein